MKVLDKWDRMDARGGGKRLGGIDREVGQHKKRNGDYIWKVLVDTMISGKAGGWEK